MTKTIKIQNPENKKTYTLEFTRKTVAILERSGFEIKKLTDQPASMVPMLFQGAFLANHDRTKNETIEKMYEGLGDKVKLIQTLAEMYHEAYSTLFDSDETAEEGNPGWKVEEL